MANIPVGTKGEQKVLVTSEIAIDFVGMDGARVLATPHMIGYMERTCRDTVLPLLDPGYDTVGTHVNVAHLAAAPMGMMVTFRAEVIGVKERRVEFELPPQPINIVYPTSRLLSAKVRTFIDLAVETADWKFG